MQTILGAGGTIGSDLAKELAAYTDKIRLVSRNPKKVNESDELYTADLGDPTAVEEAIKGSEVVYITVGFEYLIKVWRDKWPPLIKAVIAACKKHNAKLVFFDNVYLYDSAAVGHFTENSPINPPSKKGKVRAEIANMIMDEVKAGTLTALIARAADFYGPNNQKSVLIETIYKNLKNGKKPTLIVSDKYKHSYTYTPDAAKATALLGNTPDAYGQVWHLPTDKNALTGKQWVELFAKEMGKDPKYMVLSSFMIGLIGLFVPFMKELHEMLYQYDRDYYFDSTKFEKRFNFTPTSYEEGAKAVVATG